VLHYNMHMTWGGVWYAENVHRHVIM